MVVNPDVDGCSETLNTPKNSKKQQPTYNQNNIKNEIKVK